MDKTCHASTDTAPQVVIVSSFRDLPFEAQVKAYRDWRNRRLALMDAEFAVLTGTDNLTLKRLRTYPG